MRKHRGDGSSGRNARRRQMSAAAAAAAAAAVSVAGGTGRGFCREVSCTTFNILAPIYKRLDENCRESQHRCFWFTRNEMIIDRLMSDRSSIICLQEVWLGNDELVEMYEKRLGEVNYTLLKLPRTNNRGDGLVTAINKSDFSVVNYRELLFNDIGDRVAQLLHLESISPSRISGSGGPQETLVVNTHLLFPHDHSLSIIRLKQVYKILQYVESYQKEQKLGAMPIILAGDWNGSKRGHVYKLLRSQGFISSYDAAHQYNDSDADAHKWVSHRNHRGNICGVDFIWLRNPNNHRKPLKTSWNEALFSIVKYLLHRVALLSEENAFALLKADSSGDYITYSSFCQALCQLGVVHSDRLSAEEIEDLWFELDSEGNGCADYQRFQQCIWSPRRVERPDNDLSSAVVEAGDHSVSQDTLQHHTFGFSVKGAMLFPPEAEQGMWPENYQLSDHTPLTVVFSPVRLSQQSCQPVF